MQTSKRGRRPGGHDTRETLIAAARAVFAESGYEGATVREIAARARVDAAMVNHWFGSKEGLFAEAVLQLPFHPAELVEVVLAGDSSDIGARIVRTFVNTWDAADGGVFVALMRSVTSHEQATVALRDILLKHVVARVVASVSTDSFEYRAAACASQLVGLGMVRYVVRFEPMASAPVETVVATIGPTIQHYLTGPLDVTAH